LIIKDLVNKMGKTITNCKEMWKGRGQRAEGRDERQWAEGRKQGKGRGQKAEMKGSGQ
jgi:hypothetical protein